MASEHAHRRELCRRIRDELIYLGRVTAGPAVMIADGQRASVGDLIVCTSNDHHTEAGQRGRTLANGDVLRIEAIGGQAVVVRRALDADPRAGARRWSDRFAYPGYAEAELGYAVTDHAAHSRTVHTGLQLITGTETRQQAYVGLSRGTTTNMAFVFTTTPGIADAEPGPRPAAEIARAQWLALDHHGHKLSQVGAFDATKAVAVLSGVLARDGAELSATQVQEQSFAAVDDLAILHAQWQAVTSAARTARWRELLLRTVPDEYRAEPGHQARWLWRTLRAAELAGLSFLGLRATRGRTRSFNRPSQASNHPRADRTSAAVSSLSFTEPTNSSSGASTSRFVETVFGDRPSSPCVSHSFTASRVV